MTSVNNHPELADAQRLVRAAAHLGDVPIAQLEDAAGRHGKCRRTDPEQRDQWWPGLEGGTRSSDPAGRARRAERTAAERACAECPVQLLCLAASYLTDHGRWGIWGALGARDRHELRPVWEEQRAELAATPAASDGTSRRAG